MDIFVSSYHDELYNDLIKLCTELKLVLGPEGLSSTLRRHKSLRDYLVSYQAESIRSFENAIVDIEH